MFDNIIIFIAAACGTAAILTTLIRIYRDYIYKPSPSEVLKCDALEKGILSVNEARTNAGFEPFYEIQKVAHDFGETKPSVNVGGSTIRRATNCPNCGANLTQNGVCVYCGTTYD